MISAPIYDDDVGWVRLDGLLTPSEAEQIAESCEHVALDLREPQAGDKPHGATRRLTALQERVPETRAIANAFGPLVDQILPPGWTITEIAYRAPGPGTGHQQLHADDLPRADPTSSHTGVTAIVALAPFTAENGATRVVPGTHRRVDLQRQSQTIDHLPGEEHLTGPAGTGFVFTRHLLHAGSLNQSTSPRPALQISYRSLI